MTARHPNICVCVPTFQRPQMLARCLEAIASQEQVPLPYSVVVVDNDPSQSALAAVQECQRRLSLSVRYVHEPRQNISLARNAAVANADGAYVAFVDDDECPEPSWLRQLYGAMVTYRADGVLGPVLPNFAGRPPAWLVKSGLCDRESFATGTWIVDSRYLRTGNALLAQSMFQGSDSPFDPRLGRTGGEDADFLSRMVAKGLRFVWCAEARVHEEVPPERQTLDYHMRRAFVRGVTEADARSLFSFDTLKSVMAVLVYTPALPVLFVAGRHLFARYWIRWCDHAAKLLAHFGVRLARARTF